MSIKSKVIIATTAMMLGLASPAFAQSFSSSFGTGNEMPSTYDNSGVLHSGTAQTPSRTQIARRTGESAFAMVPNAASGIDSPSLTGGGSVGYNESLRTNY
jgi:hypothetical protein